MNTGLLGGIVFVVVFAGIILIHEIGHFVAARLFGIPVEEFGFGIPPRIVKLFTWRGTDFTLNWIPLGGFNKFKGEEDPNTPGGLASANPWKRIGVLLAGGVMNILTAVVIYGVLITQSGVPDKVIINKVAADSPAAQAGIQVGDIVTQAGGQEIHAFSELYNYTTRNAGSTIELTLQRGGQTLTVSLIPRKNPPAGEGATGVEIYNAPRPAKFFTDTVPLSFKYVAVDVQTLLSLPGRIIAGTISPKEAQLSGPRSIWNLFQASVARDVSSRQTTTTGEAPAPTNYTLLVIISLTVTVGLANLLPIPALDGGRIFMTLIEIIIRRPIPAKYQMMINGAGFIILMCLLGFFYIKDLINPATFTLP